ncbi:MAG: UPF0149 family protein [Pseudomonadota bacterium]
MITLPTYTKVSNEVKSLSNLSPAMVHGLICGYICGRQTDINLIYKTLHKNKTTKPSAQSLEILKTIFAYSSEKLTRFDFSFQLLLPSDRAALSKRAASLSLWCEGFIISLNHSIELEKLKISQENQEAIKHLIKISELEHEVIEAREDDENGYTEIVEYVRMVVLSIYSELNRTSSNQNHLH